MLPLYWTRCLLLVSLLFKDYRLPYYYNYIIIIILLY
nr:MAG TPA: hypothetical protein [Caudoviricetes sp.]